MQYQHQVIIDRPVPTVFAYMDDTAQEPAWQPALLEARKDPPGPTGIGTRKHYVSEFMGRRIENTYLTTLFEVDRRVQYETTADSVLRARVDLRFEPAGGGTRVTMVVAGKPTGPLRFFPQAVLEGLFRKELERSLALLKRHLEGHP